ncbi:SprT family zinc-dependent metalloprotease [Aquipseudomonas alcaligenes]|uniref:hypothetical protein n=1 Tax=Aquipseudomonas alcaligenes TaxID=43263 RepID=UPI000E033791|nr:Uncharacterised protein [Pseudomonas alcaligenes]
MAWNPHDWRGNAMKIKRVRLAISMCWISGVKTPLRPWATIPQDRTTNGWMPCWNWSSISMSIESRNITVSGLTVEVVRKPIKNLHLGVYPPQGRVRVAAPLAVDDEAVRLAVVGKLGWIKRQRAKFQAQPGSPSGAWSVVKAIISLGSGIACACTRVVAQHCI